MTTMTTRGVAILLALSMMAVTVPGTPAAADHVTSYCDADEKFTEKGWIGVSHPGVNQNIRVSQTLYLRLFNEGFAPSSIPGASLQHWTNGQDAYVIDLPCRTTGVESFCIERLNIVEDREGFTGVPIWDPGDHDYRVAFYGPGSDYDLKDNVNPEAQDAKDTCNEPVPAEATFAVVYLASGTVSGIQIDHHLHGPYTEHFDFGFTGTKAGFGD